MKLKKIVSSVMVVAMLGLVGCGSDNSDMTQLEKIQDKGVLVMGTSADYPPYEYHAMIDGKDTIVGFDIDLANEIASELGVELEIQDMDFDGIIGAITAGIVDVGISGFSPTPEREEVINFTDIYFTDHIIVLSREDNADNYKTLADLDGAVIGAQLGSIQEEIAKEQIAASDIKCLSSIADLVLELQNGNVDAIVVTSVVAEGYMQATDGLKITDVVLEESGEGSAIAINKSDDTSLVDAINEVIADLQSQGKIDEFFINAIEYSN